MQRLFRHARTRDVFGLAVVMALLGCGGGGSGGGETRANATAGLVPIVGPVTPVTPATLVTSAPPVLSSCKPTATGGLTVSLCANRVTGVAPLSVFFDSGDSLSPTVTNKPFHDIKYTWNFGDYAGGATWGYGSRPNQMLKNVASGAVAAHVFETPGTYTVMVTAFDGVNTGSRAVTITVTDPNVVFSGASTICVANGSMPVAGNNDCPAGAAVRNLATVNQITSLASAGNVRILLKRGDSWTVTSGSQITKSNGILGAYGTGAAPKITLTTNNDVISFGTAVSNWVVMDLEVTSTGGVNGRTMQVAADLGTHSNILGLRIRAYNVGGVELNGDYMYLVDSNLSELKGGNGYVGFWSMMGKGAVSLGNRIYDCTGIEHNIRFQGMTDIVVSNNTLAVPADSKHALTIRGRSMQQYTGRKDTWSGVWTEKVVVSDNDIAGRNGSGWPVQFAPQDTTDNAKLRNVIFERNIVTAPSASLVSSQVISGLTVRNNLFYAPGQYDVISISHSNIYTEGPDSSYIYNNTVYAAGSGAPNYVNFVAIYKDSGISTVPTGTVIRNNLISGPTLASAAIVISSAGATWVESNNSTPSQIKSTPPGFTVPPVAVVDWKIAAGSYAVGAGAQVPVWDDFFLTPRTGSYSLGAVAP